MGKKIEYFLNKDNKDIKILAAARAGDLMGKVIVFNEKDKKWYVSHRNLSQLYGEIAYEASGFREISLEKAQSIFNDIPPDEILFPSIEMNNFVVYYLKNEINSEFKEAVDEWIKLKELNIQKDYESWKLYVSKNNK